MKYTIDEEKKTITIHSIKTKLTVEYITCQLRPWPEFEIIFELDEPEYKVPPPTMITDSGYEDIKYVYSRECDCGRNGAICSCELKNKK